MDAQSEKLTWEIRELEVLTERARQRDDPETAWALEMFEDCLNRRRRLLRQCQTRSSAG